MCCLPGVWDEGRAPAHSWSPRHFLLGIRSVKEVCKRSRMHWKELEQVSL